MRLSLALQIARGMQFLHSLHLIHCDMKSPNVMLGHDLLVKIIDFGTTRIVGKGNENDAALGTAQWLAPEVFNRAPFTQSCDVYSFGVVLWELVTRTVPWSGKEVYEIPPAVQGGERPSIPQQQLEQFSKKDQPFLQLMNSCWHQVPNKRQTFSQIVDDLTKQCEEYHLYM